MVWRRPVRDALPLAAAVAGDQRRSGGHLLPEALGGVQPARSNHRGAGGLWHLHDLDVTGGASAADRPHLCPLEWHRHRGHRVDRDAGLRPDAQPRTTDRHGADHRRGGDRESVGFDEERLNLAPLPWEPQQQF